MSGTKTIAHTPGWYSTLTSDLSTIYLIRLRSPEKIKVQVKEIRDLLVLLQKVNEYISVHDEASVDDTLLTRAESLLTPWELLSIAQSRVGMPSEFSRLNSETAFKTILILKRAVELLSGYNYQRARAERLIAELWLAQGEYDRALQHFYRAWRQDPKVGVKKKIRKLERILALNAKAMRQGEQ